MIPMASDLAPLIGEFAEGVENRSLLFEKFSLPKLDLEGRQWKDAGRWSVLRIVTRGGDLLREDSSNFRRRASGRNVDPRNAEQFEAQAQVAEKLSKVGLFDTLSGKALEKNKRFLEELSTTYGKRVATLEARLAGRLLVNLAGGVVENAGICLDRCFGLPYLPGSAVKGIVRATALWEITAESGEKKRELLRKAMLIFGHNGNDLKKGDFAWAAGETGLAVKIAGEEVDRKGCVTFLPGLPLGTPKLVVDMINSHYPKYYQGRSKKATDDENPVPNYFPAVEAGSAFGFALVVEGLPENCEVGTEAILAQARAWLEAAITQKGAGAKAAAGYGWFQVGDAMTPGTLPDGRGSVLRETEAGTGSAEVSAAEGLIAAWQGRLKTKDNFPAALPKLAELTDVGELRTVFEAVIPEAERRKTRKGNPYWQAFTSGKHGETGKKILDRLGIKLS